MNNHSHEEDAHVDPSELATELHDLWHLVQRGAEQSSELRHHQRQQFWVLGALAKGPRRMSEIAGRAHTSQASLTGIVDRLEEQGLVRRTRSDLDRRVVEVEATSEGLRAMRVAHDAMKRRIMDLVEPLSQSERAELLRLLRRINSK